MAAPLSFLLHSNARGRSSPGLGEVCRAGLPAAIEPAIEAWLLALKPREPRGSCMAGRVFRSAPGAGALHCALALADCSFDEESVGRSPGKFFLALLTPARDDGSGLESLALVECAAWLAKHVPDRKLPLETLLARLREQHERGLEHPAPDPALLSQLPAGTLRSFLRSAYLALPNPDRRQATRAEWLLPDVPRGQETAAIAMASAALPVILRHALAWSYDIEGDPAEGLAVRRARPGEVAPNGPPNTRADAYADWLEMHQSSPEGRREILRITQDPHITSWDDLLQAIALPAAPRPPALGVTAAALPHAEAAAESAWWNEQSEAIHRSLREYLDQRIEDLRQSLPGTQQALASRGGDAPGQRTAGQPTAGHATLGGRPYRTYALVAAALVLALLAISSAWLEWRLGDLGRRVDALERAIAARTPSAGSGATSAPTPRSTHTVGDRREPASAVPLPDPQRPATATLAAGWQGFLADRQSLIALCKKIAKDRLTTAAQRPLLVHLQSSLEAGTPLTADQEAELRTLLFEYAACLTLPGLRRHVDRHWDSLSLTGRDRAQLVKKLSADDTGLAGARPGGEWEQAVILHWSGRDLP